MIKKNRYHHRLNKHLTIDNYSLFRHFLIIGICIVCFSCQQENNDRLPDPQIKAGIARVTGKITNRPLIEDQVNSKIYFNVLYPITAERNRFEISLNKDGSFHFEVPVECNTIGYIVSKTFSSAIHLIPDEETQVEISYDATGNAKVTMPYDLGLTSYDLQHLTITISKMLDHRSPGVYERHYSTSPYDFTQGAMEGLEEKLKIATNDSTLSVNAKNIISNEFKLIMLDGRLLNYSEMIRIDYKNSRDTSKPDTFVTPRNPGRSYYIFLKHFDLNDPQYLYNSTYSNVLQTILSNDTLNIPAIRDTPINDWLKGVKAIMAELIGSDTGLFYEMLTANAYARQFNNELKPLSDKQKENIKNYFENKEITKILLTRNEKIVQLNQEKGEVTIHETPVVPKAKLMEAIVSTHKGKAVIVDFWATWCGPCLDAMKEFREVKSTTKDKAIAFVYISNVSSPKKLWEEKTKGIGGEHYYLSQEEWEYLFDQYGFESIPTYLFFDAKGELKNKLTAYPGNEKMQQKIEELLQGNL